MVMVQKLPEGATAPKAVESEVVFRTPNGILLRRPMMRPAQDPKKAAQEPT